MAELAEPDIADPEVLVKSSRRGDRPRHVARHDRPALPRRLYFGLRKPKRPVPGLDIAGDLVEGFETNVTRCAHGYERLSSDVELTTAGVVDS